MEPAVRYWLTPVSRGDEQSAGERIRILVGEKRVYVLGNKTQNRESIKRGDYMCFYIPRTGVVAHAVILSAPTLSTDEAITRKGKYPWVIKLGEPALYLESPTSLDAGLREKLEALRGHPTTEAWGWYVMSTRGVSDADFRLLTGGRPIPR